MPLVVSNREVSRQVFKASIAGGKVGHDEGRFVSFNMSREPRVTDSETVTNRVE